MPHLNNKQNKNTNPIISRQEYHLTQPCPLEEKQTNKHSAQISPYIKLITYHWINHRSAETIGVKKVFNLLQGKNSTFLEAWQNETSNNKFFLKMKRQKILYKWRNKLKHRSPNKWRGNRQTTWKKFRIMIERMIKNLENKMEKMQESI